jgi:ankyrin repeat protein
MECSKGSLEIEHTLLNNGANINEKNNYGRTVLMKAAITEEAWKYRITL